MSAAGKVKRAVFLDRDGVVNRAVVREGKPFPPATLADFEVLPEAAETMRDLRKAGFVVIIVTNQPDVATGVQKREVVEEMHRRLLAAGLCDAVKVCYHTDADGCVCRKPLPGMLVEAAKEWQLDLAQSFIVGDRWRDVAAGNAVRCFTFFVDRHYAEELPDTADAVVASLEEAGRMILHGGLTRTSVE